MNGKNFLLLFRHPEALPTAAFPCCRRARFAGHRAKPNGLLGSSDGPNSAEKVECRPNFAQRLAIHSQVSVQEVVGLRCWVPAEKGVGCGAQARTIRSVQPLAASPGAFNFFLFGKGDKDKTSLIEKFCVRPLRL